MNLERCFECLNNIGEKSLAPGLHIYRRYFVLIFNFLIKELRNKEKFSNAIIGICKNAIRQNDWINRHYSDNIKLQHARIFPDHLRCVNLLRRRDKFQIEMMNWPMDFSMT